MGGFYQKLKFYYSINWIKTLYFNFSKFPFDTAQKLPVYFYGSVKFKDISGEIQINAPIKTGMIGFGQPYEIISRSKGIAEFNLEGKITFNGHVQFGKDYLVHIAPGAQLEMGNMASLGHSGKIICYHKITFGNYARIGYESQLADTTVHQMINTITNEKYPMTGPINIGNYNYISNRVTILANTNTPDFCTVASNSVCAKDYTSLGNNILLGGIPVELLKTNISRDWEGEMKQLEKWLIV
ncbi:acyltransferase [Flavobacterium wongokense]|uniref:acyltransferase n=1 Tax=Flavobacterium wongokense TaxID=2910674 RepID=UPI001F15D1D7|nr:transferase [Flavobacterium sp. WG47]MCF6130694.1 transferase [Flavobacterium sp. WG47]